VWTASEHDNVQNLRLPPDRVWRPDVLLYNSVDKEFYSVYHTNVVVYADGTVNWVPPGILRFSCKMDITFFPFDEQLCWMKVRVCVHMIISFQFGSWSFDGTKIDLEPEGIGLVMSDYVGNGEFDIYS
jgi:nicotinic acetylcholine receptor